MNGRFSKEYIEALAHKYRSGTLTPQEQADFEAWYISKDDGTFAHSDAGDPRRVMRRMYRNIRSNTRPTAIRRLRRWLSYAAAALLVTSTVGYFAVVSRQSTVDRPGIADVAPGGNRATLTLVDGRTIDLSEAQTGIVIGDGITYLDGSTVLGEQVNEGASEHGPNSPHGKLTTYGLQLTTPKGGTYQITLPDGSNVWLNSASTLKYPSRFDGAERVVQLTGEAYFDVSEQAHSLTNSLAHKLTRSQKIPFKVITHGQTVEVLGTQFNISAYPDEPETQTTLVEGSVRLSLVRELSEASLVPDKQAVLRPGEQGLLINNVIQTRTVDVTQYTAWKDGDIVLTGVPLPTLLRQIARWYDVEVEIGSDPGAVEFFGTVSRQRKLSSVLEAMEATGKVRFQLAGNKLIVNPN